MNDRRLDGRLYGVPLMLDRMACLWISLLWTYLSIFQDGTQVEFRFSVSFFRVFLEVLSGRKSSRILAAGPFFMVQ